MRVNILTISHVVRSFLQYRRGKSLQFLAPLFEDVWRLKAKKTATSAKGCSRFRLSHPRRRVYALSENSETLIFSPFALGKYQSQSEKAEHQCNVGSDVRLDTSDRDEYDT